ncbi:hypothetical protein K490DRAFT_60562 [Saccharata proteae CBS 121410]|uniref:Proteasome inhibitor PI31 subunit n=1 Tax=Saccharata proteae CBS 121410 TaxID=1314787 RepID=A0A9P4HP27_9PEZI|nr:hypothetical protein K490DRAFT_60562 [Saccharata proteae CBS 121410]
MVIPNTAGNPLSAGSLAVFIGTSLPKDGNPQIKSPYDAIALAVHAGMIAVGFRLIGLGEDHKIEAHSEAHSPEALPIEWNASTSYAFRYAHSQSAMEYLIKVNRLGNKVVVLAVGLGDDKTATFEVVATDYVSESSCPSSPHATDDPQTTIEKIFISPGRLNDLGSLLKIKIIQKLAPGINKEGYEESAAPAAADNPNNANNNNNNNNRGEPARPAYDPLRDDRQPRPALPHPFHDPLAGEPRRPRVPAGDLPPPGFEDEFELNRPPRGMPDRNPLGHYGDSDLYPAGLGPRDPMAWGGIPRPGMGRPGGGGGMHPTFDDPLFGGRGGVGGYDPQAPPGARYDPVHPGDQPRDNRGGFPGGAGGAGGSFGGAGGRPPNPFGGFGGSDFI